MTYETAKETEIRLIEKIVENMDTNRFEQQKVSDTCVADLIVFDKKKLKFFCAEIKTRTYNLEFFKQNGMIVETNKLRTLLNKYGVTELTLFTITSDNYVLKAKVNFGTKTMQKYAKKTTCFSNSKKVLKTFYVVENFDIIYKLDNGKFIDL